MLAVEIRELAARSGIDVVRVTHAGPFEGYLLPDSPRRDPRLALPEARSIIVLGIYIGGIALPGWDDPALGRVSRLVLSGFYADVVEPLGPIVSLLEERGFRAVACDGFRAGGSVLPLKLAAVRAGMGWQGKNTLLISRHFGSFLALGGILTDAPLQLDDGSEEGRCGRCRACQEACPLGALEEPYRLKRERCLSHLLSRESLSGEARRAMGNRVLECDLCQTVCPWNRGHLERPLDTPRTRSFRRGVDELAALFRLPRLFHLSEPEFEELFGPLRTGTPYRVFRRNVVAALGHWHHPDAAPLLRAAVEDADPEIGAVARAALDSAGETGSPPR